MKFKVIVNCQGQPFEYKYKNLFSALCGYAYHYIKKNKYGTMNFTLKQIPSWEQQNFKEKNMKQDYKPCKRKKCPYYYYEICLHKNECVHSKDFAWKNKSNKENK